MEGKGVFRPADQGIPTVGAMVDNETTEWADVRDNMDLVVIAGAERPDPSQGLIIVLESNQCTGQHGNEGSFPTPRRIGALTLTSVSGDVVSFSYRGGTGTFNLASHRYLFSSP